ncbi:MAG: tetratricopeptide repeat protein [bacterium]
MMTTRPSGCGALVIGSLLLLGSIAPAHARTKRLDPDALIQEAKAAFKAGQYTKALRSFQRAYALDLSPNHLANVAMCFQKLGQWNQALAHFRRALAEGQKSLTAPQLARIRTKMEKILRITSLMRIDVNVAGAEVRIDTAVVGTTPLPGPVRLSNGPHRLEVFHVGKLRNSRQFEAGPGYPDRITIVVVLPPRPHPGDNRALPVLPKPKEKPFGSGWSFEAAIVGIVGTVAYLALGIPGFIDGLKCDPDRPPDAPRCGVTGFYLYAGGGLVMAAAVPVVYVGGLSTRKKASVKGVLGLQVASWVSYGLLAVSAIGMAAFLMKNEPIHPAWPGVTLAVGASAGVFMTIDAFITHYRYRRKARARKSRPTPPARAGSAWQWRPLISLSRGVDGKVTPILGLHLTH